MNQSGQAVQESAWRIAVESWLRSRGYIVVLLGVVGGLAAGGILGLFIGATLLSVFYTMLKEWVESGDENSGAAQEGNP